MNQSQHCVGGRDGVGGQTDHYNFVRKSAKGPKTFDQDCSQLFVQTSKSPSIAFFLLLFLF